MKQEALPASRAFCRPIARNSERKIPMTIHVRHTHAYINTFCFKQAFIILAYTTFVWSSTLYFFNLHSSAGKVPHLVSLIERDSDSLPSKFSYNKDRHFTASNGVHTVKDDSDYPSLTIFSAPKPYSGHPDDQQRRALLSWMRMVPTPKIVLLGNHSSFDELAAEFSPYVSVEMNIDFNFMGVPQFHSMIARAQAADTDLSMLINGDIILLNDLMPAVIKMNSRFPDWVMTCQRWDVDADFPYSFEAQGRIKDPEFDITVKQYAHSRGILHTYGGVDLWVWNNSPTPLLKGVIPPFVFGRGKYDNWFMHEVITSGNRQVIDASDSITSIHVAHSYQHVQDSASKSDKDISERFSFWSTRKKSSWELFTNIHLAQSFGTYKNQKGTAMHAAWRLATCHEPASGNTCLLKRIRPANCSCEYASYSRQTLTDARVINQKWVCGAVSIDKESDYSIPTSPSLTSAEGLPHTMSQLLPKLAKQVGKLKIVTLVAVSGSYSSMLMNFVCRLRRLNLADNLVVAALDESLYRFAYTQGLPVYLEGIALKAGGSSQSECPFGTQCFRDFTKLKSKAVLRVLEAGYSVLWSDVDIVWFSDPLPNLLSFGSESLPIQSNEPDARKVGTGIRRINSGFYFARSEPRVIKAFREIVAHAATSRLSEQPSFYDVLCGTHGENVIKRRGMCKWQRRLRVMFLDRKLYPNGAVHSIWSSPNVTAKCQELGCIILHNNWISGMHEKQNRMVVNGFWHYDEEKRMCVHDWYKKRKDS